MSSDVSSDGCMGEGSQILIRFGGPVGQGDVLGVVWSGRVSSECVYG